MILFFAAGCAQAYGQFTLSHPAFILLSNSNHSGSPYSFIQQPASLASEKSKSIGLYADRKFMLPELSGLLIAGSLTTAVGQAGIYLNRFGFADFMESRIGISYGRSLTKSVEVGSGFYYHARKVAIYGKDGAPGVILHSRIKLTPQLTASMGFENVVGGKYSKTENEKLPRIFSFGCGFDASTQCFFGVMAVKEEDQPLNILAGIRYMIVPAVIFMIGVKSVTGECWTGAGFQKNKIGLEIITGYHPVLGISPGLSISYMIKKKEV